MIDILDKVLALFDPLARWQDIVEHFLRQQRNLAVVHASKRLLFRPYQNKLERSQTLMSELIMTKIDLMKVLVENSLIGHLPKDRSLLCGFSSTVCPPGT